MVPTGDTKLMKKLIVASAYPLRFSKITNYKSLREVVTTSRIQTIPDDFNFRLLSEKVADLKPVDLSFEQCCEQRVRFLENLNKPTRILWSGGIDSTCALISILKYGTDELKKRTTVLFNIYSLREYQEIFPLIAQNFKMDTSFQSLSNFVKDGIIVTGELGDQLFGSDLIFDLVSQQGEASLLESYEKTLPNLFKDRSGEVAGRKLFEKYQNIISDCPFEVKTSFDFLWWWNFSQKWQHVKFRYLVSDHWPDIRLATQNVHHFYDSVQFQGWSISNHEKKIEKSLSSYKYVVKDLIVNTTKHEFYKKKLKMGSLGYIWFGKKAHFAIDEDFNYVPAELASQYLKENSK